MFGALLVRPAPSRTTDRATTLGQVSDAYRGDAYRGDGGDRADQPREALDPDYVAGAVDLLGVLAYEELTTYQALSVHAYSAPTLADRIALCRYAVAGFAHLARFEDRIRELGPSLAEAMEPFAATIDDLNRRTPSETWLEGLVKASVTAGIVADFYGELARLVDPRTRAVVEAAVVAKADNDYLVEAVRAAVEPGSKEASRLSLWGRRLVGEALTLAQQVAADREGMALLLVGTVERPGADLGEIGEILRRVTNRHTERMTRMGLTS